MTAFERLISETSIVMRLKSLHVEDRSVSHAFRDAIKGGQLGETESKSNFLNVSILYSL